jgi:membrane protein
MVMWVAGSVLLRYVLTKSIGGTTIYGPLAAPIAFLIWLYVISIAVLIGAAFNSSLDEFFPRLSGINHEAAQPDQPLPAEKNQLRRTLAGGRGGRRVKSQ